MLPRVLPALHFFLADAPFAHDESIYSAARRESALSGLPVAAMMIFFVPSCERGKPASVIAAAMVRYGAPAARISTMRRIAACCSGISTSAPSSPASPITALAVRKAPRRRYSARCGQRHDGRDASPPQPAQQQGRDQPGDDTRERLAVEHGNPDSEDGGLDCNERPGQRRHGAGAERRTSWRVEARHSRVKTGDSPQVPPVGRPSRPGAATAVIPARDAWQACPATPNTGYNRLPSCSPTFPWGAAPPLFPACSPLWPIPTRRSR